MISVKDNAIDKSILDAVRYYLAKGNWTYGWASNKNMPYGHWNLNITHTTPNNPTDVSVKLPPVVMELWKQVNQQFFNGEATLTRCYANKQTFGTEGYIHTDTERDEDLTCVVYIDEEWDINWGGETIFYKKDYSDAIKLVSPKYGRTAVFKGNIPHRASSVSRICPVERTTLMFKVTINPTAMFDVEAKLSEFLESIGAKQWKHKTGSLHDHLIRTFHILKEFGAEDTLALAGGLHSVYGTNAFTHSVLAKDSTLILDTFGEDVDRLVRLFSKIDRPNCLENPVLGALSDVDLFLLRCIECANLYDQDELTEEQYPALFKFAKQMTKANT